MRYSSTCPDPECAHPKYIHDSDGCSSGWDYDEDGIATTNGCECGITGFEHHHTPQES